MSDKPCPVCNGKTTHILGGKNEFKTYRCNSCRHEFKTPPDPKNTLDKKISKRKI